MRWLPETAAYRISTGPEGRRWTGLDEKLADLIELLSIVASKDTVLRSPIDYPRPRYAEATPEPSDKATVAAFFGMVYVPQADQEETVE